jgi:2-amino-4-hydroxy-6-hydroxymethyldihydropteridine diphosphokinase
MPECLLGLGSNLGDNEATLRAAVAEISALPDVQVVRHSEWHRTKSIGGPPDQPYFVNGAALVESTVPPLRLLAELQQIETRHGRQRGERWAPRTLDIDILLYGNDVSETPMLTLPHPRMTFRKFVLEPAVEIAPKLLHPTIGWPIERMLLHLQQASNQLALVTPSDELRHWLAKLLTDRAGARSIERPTFATVNQFWPPLWTTWLEVQAAPWANAAAADSRSAGNRSRSLSSGESRVALI